MDDNTQATANTDRAEIEGYLRKQRQTRSMSIDEYLQLQHVKRQLAWLPEFERMTHAKIDELQASYRYQSAKLMVTNWLLAITITAWITMRLLN